MHKLFNRGKMASACLLASVSPILLAQGFWEDSKGRLTLRNFYFNDDYRDGGEDRKEWAQGFLLNLQSGYTEGTLGFGLDALGLAGLRLDVVDHTGDSVEPFGDAQSARDQAGRRFPAHLDVVIHEGYREGFLEREYPAGAPRRRRRDEPC